MRPCSLANCSPSSVVTARRCCARHAEVLHSDLSRSEQSVGFRAWLTISHAGTKCRKAKAKITPADGVITGSVVQECVSGHALSPPPPETFVPPRTVRSLLFPMSMMVMLGLACCRASSSQLARWLNVSRLRRISKTKSTVGTHTCAQALSL
eukprot:8195-Chlamydomonas_euryale.AAC.3